MVLIICSLLGILPSTIWLLFFLRQDAHPESNRMIIKVFLLGAVAAFYAIVYELGSDAFLNILFTEKILFLLKTFIGISLVEEFFKYLVVKKIAITDSEFDEPLDAMLYMVIVGLGFAAVENVIYLFPIDTAFNISETISLAVFRFLGATFLHALSSGIVGFFLALSIWRTRSRLKLITIGLILATLLHGFYNLSIIKIGESSSARIYVVLLLLGAGIFILLAFRKLKKLSSICKIIF